MKQKSYTPATILLGLLVISTLVLTIFVIKAANDSKNAQTEYAVGTTLDNYRLAKLEFCYANTIKPCDDETITAWNTQNPSNTFTIKSFSQLTEEGIQFHTKSKK